MYYLHDKTLTDPLSANFQSDFKKYLKVICIQLKNNHTES